MVRMRSLRREMAYPLGIWVRGVVMMLLFASSQMQDLTVVRMFYCD